MTTYDISYLAHHLGITGRTAEALEVLRVLWPEDDGPAHIVIADLNLRDGDIQWCIDQIDKGKTFSLDLLAGHPVFAATRAVLVSMLEVPEAERMPKP